MKVGTDGVLLGAWAPVNDAHNALDVGTGSGLIALMLAQRNSNIIVDGIDIDADATVQAQQNIASSSFANRIKVWTTPFEDIEDTLEPDKRYDLIVSNPPFYKEKTNCPDVKRNEARHVSSLPTDILVSTSARLLTPKGVFCLIVPTDVVIDIIGECALNKLYLCHRTDIYTTPRKQPKRTMLTFSYSNNTTSCFDKLYLRNDNNELSSEYKELTKEFYLEMK